MILTSQSQHKQLLKDNKAIPQSSREKLFPTPNLKQTLKGRGRIKIFLDMQGLKKLTSLAPFLRKLLEEILHQTKKK